MTHDFWTGFSKAASLLDAAKKGVTEVIDYRKLQATTQKLPMWKRRMMEAGKKPVGVEAKQMPPKVTPDVHADAAAELAKRREAMQKGGLPHSQWQKIVEKK